MMIENRIRELARLDGGAGEILSMYVDTRRGDGEQKDRIRLFLKNEIARLRGQMGGNGHDDRIQKMISAIETRLASEREPHVRGIAVFAGPDPAGVEALELPVEVDPQVTLGPRPALRQLIRLRDRHPAVVVLRVDARSADVWRVEMNRVVYHTHREAEENTPRNPRTVHAESVDRHLQEQVDRHLRDTAAFFEKYASDKALAGVILAGQEHHVASFRALLSQTSQDRILGEIHLDARARDEDVRKAADELLEQRRTSIARERLEQIRASVELGRRGADKVCDAANQRRLACLVVSNGATATGWRCTSCGIIGSTVPLGCPACGSPIVTLDLIEELIAHAEFENAEVVLVDSPSELDERDGIGAVLRF